MEAHPVSKIVANPHEEWFSNFIGSINHQIETDKRNLESGNASQITRDFYKSLVSKDIISTLSISRKTSSDSLIKLIILEYLKLLGEKQVAPSRLAIDISTNKILVWAEVKENDEKTEAGLIRIESIINGQFADKTGIYLDSIIVEDSDHLTVPPHYAPIVIN